MRSQTALTVILLGFNNGHAGRMAVHPRWRAALSQCGELPGGSASAVAAVYFRTKASGRSVVRRVPRGPRCARFLLWAGDEAGFTAYLADLRQRHRRKTSFIAKPDRALAR
jgi:hypothetical protein